MMTNLKIQKDVEKIIKLAKKKGLSDAELKDMIMPSLLDSETVKKLHQISFPRLPKYNQPELKSLTFLQGFNDEINYN